MTASVTIHFCNLHLWKEESHTALEQHEGKYFWVNHPLRIRKARLL